MKAVLDASIFFSDVKPDGELYTTPSVCDELRDIRSKGNFEKLCAGLHVVSPGSGSLDRVRAAAVTTRDSGVISDTDREFSPLRWTWRPSCSRTILRSRMLLSLLAYRRTP